MQIEKGIDVYGLCLYLEDFETLIITDIHLGLEEVLNKMGYLIETKQYEKTKKELENVLKRLKNDKKKVKTIIINGDLKHEFGSISRQEWRDSLNMLSFLEENCDKVILIKGNHDRVMEPIAKTRDLEVIKEYQLGDILITHGDFIPKNIKAKTIIIGHEHPAVSLTDNITTEQIKCFLKGKWRNKTIIVQPSMNVLTEGTDVLKEYLSPFLKGDTSSFECYIPLENEVLYFGKLGQIAYNNV